MNKCPCEECISFAICNNRYLIACNALWDYLIPRDNLNHCDILSIYKAHAVFIFVDRKIRFVKNEWEAHRLLKDNRYAGFPIITRFGNVWRYCFYRIVVRTFPIRICKQIKRWILWISAHVKNV